MANNLGYTEGSGSTVATDDVAGVHYQVVKLAAGTEDSAERITGDATNGLDVDVTRVTGTVTVDGSGVTQPVSNAGLTELAAAINSNRLDINIATSDALLQAEVGGIISWNPADTASPTSAVMIGGTDGTNMRRVKTDTNGELQIDVLSIAPGTNNIGDVDILSIAAGDNNIGNVDIVTMPNVTLAAGTNTNEVVGDVAHDAGIAGNPITTSGVSIDMDDTAPPNRVNAEADTTRVGVDRDGTQFVHPHGPQIWSYHVNGSTALTDATVHAAPGAGLSLYVTDIVFSSGAATAINAFFEEGASTVLGPYYLEAVAGRGMALHFQTPKKVTANTALTVTTSAAIAHSVDVTGFVAQG